MSKLGERLSDPARSGVYCARHDRDIRDALSAGGYDIAAAKLGEDKGAMLAALAHSLDFPDWFGGNWDALEDSLTDLSWRRDAARVLLLSEAVAGDDLGILVDVLSSAAEFWRERGRAFFAIFIDPDGTLALPLLYKEKSG